MPGPEAPGPGPSDREAKTGDELLNVASYNRLLAAYRSGSEETGEVSVDPMDGTVHRLVDAGEGYGEVDMGNYFDAMGNADHHKAMAGDPHNRKKHFQSLADIYEKGSPIISLRFRHEDEAKQLLFVPKDKFEPVGWAGSLKGGMEKIPEHGVGVFDGMTLINVDEDLYYSGLLDAIEAATSNPA